MTKIGRVVLLIAIVMMLSVCMIFNAEAWINPDSATEIVEGTNRYKLGDSRTLKFVPTENNYYRLRLDTYGLCSCDFCESYYELYDSNLDYMSRNDDNYYELKEGETYYLYLEELSWSCFSECDILVKTYIPSTVNNLGVSEVTKTSVTLKWDQVDCVDGYVIYMYESDLQNRKEVKRIEDPDITEVTISKLKKDSEYKFEIESFDDIGYGIKYSVGSSILTVFTNNDMGSVNAKISEGYFANIAHSNIKIDGNINTTFEEETFTYVPNEEYYETHGLLMGSSHGDYGSVSELTHFFDYKGYYTVVYSSNGFVCFDRYNVKLKKTSTIKIKMLYPLLGDVVTDKDGYYYIVWGKEDAVGKGGKVTMAVSKYSYNGEFIATVKYKTATEVGSWDTRIPFDAGNCSTVINSEGILICSYAREMYNGHQSNDVICVDTITMKAAPKYPNYVSHSFDQRVLELSDGNICFVNKGDAYPRGFSFEVYKKNRGVFSKVSRKSYEPFHFYGGLGANYVNAWLGGAVEVSGNLYLVGSSAKSMRSDFDEEGQNLFIQLVNSERTIKDSVIRKGTSCSESYTDKGVKWLTDYNSKYTVANPQVVEINNERFAILWEKIKITNEGTIFTQSYYMILSADGKVLQKATPMNKTRLTSHEDPVYKDGYIYWTTAGNNEFQCVQVGDFSYYYGYVLVNGNKGVIHKLKVGNVTNKFETPKISSVVNTSDGIKITWNAIYGTDKYRLFRKSPNGEWKKIKDTTETSFVDKTVENKKEYLYTVRCISSDGKKYLSGYDKKGLSIYRLPTPILEVEVKKQTVNLNWKKISGSTGYEIEYSTDKKFKDDKKIVTIRGASNISKKIEKFTNNKTYYFRIRSYKNLNGQKYYSAWSDIVKVKIRN